MIKSSFTREEIELLIRSCLCKIRDVKKNYDDPDPYEACLKRLHDLIDNIDNKNGSERNKC